MGRHTDDDQSGVADWAEGEADHRVGATVPAADDEQQYEMATARSFRAAAASSSVIYGPDIHPQFQSGISIDRIAAEGFSFLAVKASQGTSSSWAAGAKAWLDRADQLGMVTYVYHYLTTADVTAQAQTAKTAAHGRPVMVDCEAGSGNVANVRAFLTACQRIGVRVPLVYLPRWWWQQVGSSLLSGLPPIVSSRYLTATGSASAIYGQVPASFWDSYGGGTTTVLQFSDRASVAGQNVDVNAFRGTKDQLRALVYGSPAPAPTPAAYGEQMQDKYPLVGSDVDIWDVAAGTAAADGRWIVLTFTLFSGSLTGWIDFQTDKGGIGTRVPINLTVGADNLSPRAVVGVPSGATKARVGWDATRAVKASMTVTGGK